MTPEERARQFIERWCYNPQSRGYSDAVENLIVLLREAKIEGMEKAATIAAYYHPGAEEKKQYIFGGPRQLFVSTQRIIAKQIRAAIEEIRK